MLTVVEANNRLLGCVHQLPPVMAGKMQACLEGLGAWLLPVEEVLAPLVRALGDERGVTFQALPKLVLVSFARHVVVPLLQTAAFVAEEKGTVQHICQQLHALLKESPDGKGALGHATRCRWFVI